MEREPQTIPVRISDSEDVILLAAPMPGLEPQNITVSITDHVVKIKGEERGTRQHELDLKVAEWRIGPYIREVSLDQPVNGAMTNATYGNGVLVLSIPKAKSATGSNAEFKLKQIEPTRGERIGYTGSEIRPAADGKKERAS
ncbi:MAG TPA: Hsp20/alpha crystallin family protein [Candidatus Binatia bacterium]